MGKVELNLPMPMYYQLALYPGSSPAENPRFSAGEEPGYKATINLNYCTSLLNYISYTSAGLSTFCVSSVSPHSGSCWLRGTS